MADSQPFKPITIYDEISALTGGMNSGVTPLLIEKTELSYAGNVTVRDGFATCRPPFNKNLQMVYFTEEIQNAVEQGLFQGCCYYQPDSGAQSLIASISGRQFQFQITGSTVNVTEITIPGDPNPASSTQAWLWQCENFVIISDGLNLPIFWDGANTRRSYGVSQVLATTVGGEVIPAFGESIPVAFAPPYTGPFNVPVLIDGFYWQPIEDPLGYHVSAECLYDIPGTPITADTQIVAKPSILGVIPANQNFPGGNPFVAGASTQNIPITTPYTGFTDGSVVVILFDKTWSIYGTLNGGLTIQVRASVDGTYQATLPAGYQIQLASSSTPNVIYGEIAVASVAPAVGATIDIIVDSLYVGIPGQVVYIGDVGQYKITAVAPGVSPGSPVNMININAPNGSVTPEEVPIADVLSVPEIPACRMGAYGLGQNWVCLVDGTSFIPSDVVNSTSGTPAYNYRDAVLKTTVVSFDAGNFRIPTSGDIITSMSFPAVLDTSLGQGALQIGTPRTMFSCLAPIDLTVLANLAGRSPILTESLKGRGPLAQNSTINVNSDTMFRSTNGLGSLILGRREFTQSISGNTAVSEEMVRVFNSDNKKLLPYGSAINFDNRVLFTCSPQASSQGVFHSGMVALNLDSISSMRGKEPPVYDGMWTGVNALQLTQGNFGGIDRAFAFTFNVALSKIELYEILPTGSSSFDDGGIPITWLMESSSLFREDVKPKNVMLQLSGGEFAVDEVVGTVVFQVFFKPDQFGAYGQESCWIPWHTFSICASSGSKPLYYPRLGLPEPSADLCIPQLEIPARNGYTFQVRWIISGKCRLLRANFSAVTQMLPKFAAPICNATVSAPIAAAVIVPTPPPAAGVSWDDVVWSDVLFYQGSGGVASGSALGGQFIFNLNSPSALAEAYAYGLGTVSYTGGEVDCTLTITGGPWAASNGKEFGIIINHSVAGDLLVVYDPPDITTNPQVFNFTVPASTGAVITINGGLPGSPVGAFAFSRNGNGTTNGQFVVENV